ncbi:hypothetical protein FHS16_000152 [Paenibacillus endophyticus]|uniref:DUF2269 family protein n=1 Tax=Paenibacillus endophyticus TaxID=1294268 RepID=A0A7W5C3L3_9BACL|nr:hypothetical protein [Paenibacillus endophyticus]MBB3150120.1 hypothetical protein [Paenibacillus endophyticus]
MEKVMVFLHVLGAVGMGFYIVLPIMVGKASNLAGVGQGGLAEGLLSANRIAQYFLILQLLTGGYLISKADYTVAWMIIVVLLFLAIAALGGIISKPLKLVVASIQEGKSATAHISKARVMSLIVLVLYIVIIYFMKYPMYQIS